MEKDPFSEKLLIPALNTELPQSFIDKFAPNHQELEKDISRDIEKLKKYGTSENYPPFNDYFYLLFLRAAKYDFKKAKEKLKLYCSIRRDKLADFYEQHLDADMIRKVLEYNMVGILPYRDEEGNAIMYSRGDAWKAEICDFGYFVITFYLIVNVIASIPLTSLTGVRYIADVSANYYADYFLFQKTIITHSSILKAIPTRIKHINVVKDNALCRQLYRLVRPILPKKLVKRVELHGYDEESLHMSIDPNILPTEYGGTMGPLDNEFLIDKVLEYYETFKEEQIYFKTNAKK